MNAQGYPIIDGFLYNTRLRPNMTFLSMALQEFEDLRRAGAYRSRILCIPENAKATSIPAANEYTYQCAVVPGSAYWGWSFVGSKLFSIQIQDGCTKAVLFDRECCMGNVSGSLNPGQGKQNPFGKLLVIGQPGVINVTICSLDNVADTGIQLVLYGGEPVPQEECENGTLVI